MTPSDLRKKRPLTREFKQQSLSTAIAATLSASASVFAQDDAMMEEVLVSGIRSSLEQSMDIKRNATGVVDAISAEDIGKFPDTNLAESLQRITGVSIDRENGEGSKVTVRGFGPEFNLITLNGRQLPNTTGDRTFDFDNIASELVTGVNVYKTSNASMVGGGIGSTIELRSHRPLAAPGFKFTGGFKLVTDNSTDRGDITPEFSGLYSQTFADDTIGISLAASYQEREYGTQQYNSTRGPRVQEASFTDWGGVPAGEAGGVNRPTSGIYTVANQPRYEFEEHQRERTNGQLVLQFSPRENFTATVDHTYVQNIVESQAADVSVWFNYSDDRSETIWAGEPNAYPLVFSEVYPCPDNQIDNDPSTCDVDFDPAYPNGERWKDTSLTLGAWGIEETINSTGLNLEWEVSDRLTLAFDIHSSEATLSPTNDRWGVRNNVQVPSYTRTITGLDERGGLPGIATGQIELFNPNTFQLSGSWFQNRRYVSQIDQAQFTGDFQFNDEWSIDFGLGSNTVNNRFSFTDVIRNDWSGVGEAGDFADLDWREDTVFDKFQSSPSNFEGTPSEGEYDLLDRVFWTDFQAFVNLAETIDNNPDNLGAQVGDCRGENGARQQNLAGQFCASSNWDAGENRFTEEKTQSVFVQANFERELFDVHLGLRYEDTEVYSESTTIDYTGAVVRWTDATSTNILGGGELNTFNKTASYAYFLPNLNVNYRFNDALVGRFAASKTIARPGYDLLIGGTSVNTGGSLSGYSGNSGNPALKPLESENIDLAIEWYYSDTSYISLGFFQKNVSNWTSTGFEQSTAFALANPLVGPKVDAAFNALGRDASLQQVRAYIFENFADDPSVNPVDGDPNGGYIDGDPANDELVSFNVAIPVNADRSETVEGWEFNVQHLFGESGFGAIVNYTVVDTGLQYDVNSVLDTEAIVGLSDSANMVLFYDKHGIQVRIAYNWRDRFLSERRQGPDANETSPMFTQPYSQVDFSASYELPFLEGMRVFVEGINLTEDDQKIVGRRDQITLQQTTTNSRFNIGFRYTF